MKSLTFTEAAERIGGYHGKRPGDSFRRVWVRSGWPMFAAAGVRGWRISEADFERFRRGERPARFRRIA